MPRQEWDGIEPMGEFFLDIPFLDIPFYRTCPERPIGEQEIDFLLDRVRNDFVSHD